MEDCEGLPWSWELAGKVVAENIKHNLTRRRPYAADTLRQLVLCCSVK